MSFLTCPHESMRWLSVPGPQYPHLVDIIGERPACVSDQCSIVVEGCDAAFPISGRNGEVVRAPNHIEMAILRFDQMVLSCLAALIQHHGPLPILARITLRLPISKGFAGFGLRPRTDVSLCAYLGAINGSFPFFAQRLRLQHGAQLAQGQLERQYSATGTGMAVNATLQNLGRMNGLARSFPNTAEQFFESELRRGPTPKLQHDLTENLDNERKRRQDRLAAGNDSFKAMRLSRTHKGTSAARMQRLLPDKVWVHATRSQLHLPPVDDLGDLLCACGQERASNPYHFQHCRRFIRRAATWRHDDVKHFIVKECFKAGWYAEEEVRVLPRDAQIVEDPDEDVPSGTVVDIVVYTPDKTVAIDISGTCPAAPSYRQQAATVKLSAANTRAAHKRSRYEQHCRALNMDFLPGVFETTGALHKSFLKFLHDLVDAQQALLQWKESRQACKTRIMSELNAIILRGNAAIAEQALMEARIANQRGAPTAHYQHRTQTLRPRSNWASLSALVRGRVRWNQRGQASVAP